MYVCVCVCVSKCVCVYVCVCVCGRVVMYFIYEHTIEIIGVK